MKYKVSALLILLYGCGIQINDTTINDITNSGSTPESTPVEYIDQTDNDNTATGFGGGTHTGTTYTNNYLTLNTDTNNSELNESWTPHWANLVGYWNFSDTPASLSNGHVLTDHSDFGHDGVLVNSSGASPTISDGRVKQYITFPTRAGDDYFVVNDTADLRLANELTIMAWVNVNTTAHNYTYILEKGLNDNEDNYAFQLINADPTIKKLSIEFNDSGGTYRYYETTNSYECGNGWHHVAVTYNDAANEIKFFRNGVLLETLATTYSLNDTYTNNLLIGKQNWVDLDYEGGLDELAIWSKTLNTDEINLIYKKQKAALTGEYKSRIFDSLDTNSAWTNLDWITTLPFGKELPASTGSESSNDYSSLVGSTGSTNDNNLMDGLIGAWHLNEANWNGTADEVIDSSSYNNHGVSSGDAATGPYGILNRAGQFDGTGDFTTVTNSLSNEEITVSVWFKADGTANNSQIFNYFCNTSAGWGLRYTPGTLFIFDDFNNADDSVYSITAAQYQWHHAVAQILSTHEQRVYLNGELVASGTNTNGNRSWDDCVGSFYLATRGGSSNFLTGNIDEVTVWNRILQADEILQLYRRGANRIDYQVRSCTSSDCSDQDALTGDGWMGPGGNYLTYFSELHNNSSITSSCTSAQECYESELSLQGNVGATKPSIYFNSFGTDGLLGIDNNRYFQYRVIMESDDQNTVCDSGTTTCKPELKSVTIGPDHEI